jgi:hypothetical protein
MRSLACLIAVFAAVAVSSSMSACIPDDSDPNHLVVTSGGPPVPSGTGQGDNTGGGGGGPDAPDGGMGDNGFLTDGGVLDTPEFPLDAFDFPMDAAEPLNPGTDQIP